MLLTTFSLIPTLVLAQLPNFTCYDRKVELYSTTECGSCDLARYWFLDRKILVQEIDINSDSGKMVMKIIKEDLGLDARAPTVMFFKNGVRSVMSIGYNPLIWADKFCPK